MALFMYPHGFGKRATRYDPFSEIERVFDAALDDTRQLLPVPRIDADGKFSMALSTRGYEPSELAVEVEGRDLVVKGSHSSSDEHGGSVQRSFAQRLRIPEAVNLETIRADYDETQRAITFVGRANVENANKKSIPITFKASTTPSIEQAKPKATWILNLMSFKLNRSTLTI